MQVEAMGSGSQSTSSSGFGTLDQDAFMKILVAQLRYQNPLSPQQDSTEMIAQLTQFSILEQLNNLGYQMESMVGSSMAGALGNMLGKEVSYMDDQGGIQTGIAEAVIFRDGLQILVVSGVEVFPEALTSLKFKEDSDA